VRGYTFRLEPLAPLRRFHMGITPSGTRRLLRNHRVTATVTFTGRQEDTILNRPVRRYRTGAERRAKLLDDMLLLLSLLTGSNVVRASDRKYRGFPVLPVNHNQRIYEASSQLEAALATALRTACARDWQARWAKGFHLAMLYHGSQLANTEARLLLYSSMWEFMGKKSRLPAGSTLADALPVLVKEFFFGSSRKVNHHRLLIFAGLRNQVAHYGTLMPLQASGIPPWLKNAAPVSSVIGTCYSYIELFEKLTQFLALSSLDLDVFGPGTKGGARASRSFAVEWGQLVELVNTGRVASFGP